MRIINNTTKDITLTDIDRGNAGSSDPYTGSHESWGAKSYSVVPAGGEIDVFDTERVMLSAHLGQVKNLKLATDLSTKYSITGSEEESFTIQTGVNDEFIFSVAGGADQTITLPAGELSSTQVISAINTSASGLVAESGSFFRSSRTDDTELGEVEGTLGKGYGQRLESVTTGFITLVSDDVIQISDGSANATLGFLENQKTLAK
jgi:hypothetical protein